MADIYSLNGTGGCEYATMKIKSGTTLAVGKAVTITGNNEVGFAAASGTPASLFGIVSGIDGTSGYATIQVAGFAEDIACNATTNPVLGKFTAVDHEGKITAATAAVASSDCTLVGIRGICTSINATNDVATILL